MGDHARSPRVALLLFLRPAGPTDKARDYGSRDSGFESQVGLPIPIIAQLAERLTVDQLVTSSILVDRIN